MSNTALSYLKSKVKPGDTLCFHALSAPLHCGPRGIQHHYTISVGDEYITEETFTLIVEIALSKPEVIKWIDDSIIAYADAFALTEAVDDLLGLGGTLGYTVFGFETSPE